MKNILNYFYNLYPDKILKNTKENYFYYNNMKYYILKINRPLEEIQFILNINIKLESLNKAVYKILINKENRSYFEYEKDNYMVLMMIKDENEVLDIFDLYEFNNSIKTGENTILNRNDYLKLWSEKVDFYEYVMGIIKEDNLLINSSFSYFIGWAEVAISYYNNNVLNKNITLYLSHKRLNNLSCKEIYNPLNFIFDYPLRSLSEYLKVQFINKKIDYEEFEMFIDKNNFSENALKIFFARIIYPSFYFDLLDEYINTKNLSKLKEAILDIDNYEKFLKEIFYIINKRVNIPSYLN